MSTMNKLLTEEQVETLRQNPYVFSVMPTRISFTKEFKEIFYREYMNGYTPRQIFERHGFDTSILGKGRMHSMGVNIRKEYNQYGGFHQGNIRSCRKSGTIPSHEPPQTQEDQIKQMQQELSYLKQEMEFLKKIIAIRNIRK